MTDAQAARPPLALRVGITGLRKLDKDQVTRLREQVRQVLDCVGRALGDLAAIPAVAEAYDHATTATPMLQFLSPLARGADRLAAEVALDLGYTLHVPMPFPQAEYETDFTGADQPYEPPLTAGQDLEQFRTLLAKADGSWLALDGDHGRSMNRAYESVGRYVVRHSDLVIAIWDGGDGGGRGSTADIVRYATHSGVPVWWLHSGEPREPAWVADFQDLRDPHHLTNPPIADLGIYLRKLIMPPRPARRPRHGWIQQLARIGQDEQSSPEAEYFAERPLPRHWIWGAYSWLMRFASGLNPPWTPPHRPTDPVTAHWFDLYQPADARAGEYAARYRSGYVWIFALTTATLLLGAASVGLGVAGVPRALTATMAGLEFAALTLIVCLLGATLRHDWHEHSIEYRMLAELYRKQQTLASLGWALPVDAARRTSEGERADWVVWLFAAQQRAAPWLRGEIAAVHGPARTAVLKELIDEQLEYHRDRGDMAKRAGDTFIAWGARSFAAVVVCVVAKLALHWFGDHDPSVILGLLATVLPGVSAACLGIRAYSELQLLAEQSHHMAAELGQARLRVERLDPNRPMVSQDLGSEAVALAALMLQDLEGWVRLFRVKGLEAA